MVHQMMKKMKKITRLDFEMNNLTIKIKYFTDDKIEKIKNGDWIDLKSAEDLILQAGECKLIKLNVAMELPVGYEAIVAPRSSTFKNFGIIMTNSIGIIDEMYCGDNDQWRFPAMAIRNTKINKGDRICQFRVIEHQPFLKFDEVEVLGNSDRGGFGSTGVD